MTQRNKEQGVCPGCLGAPLTRRRMLSLSANGFGLTALSALMAEDAYAGLVPTPPTHFQPKVKNVILCFMPGGVSHMDTFDPKPKLNELHGQLSGDGIRTYQGCPWTFKKYGKAGIADGPGVGDGHCLNALLYADIYKSEHHVLLLAADRRRYEIWGQLYEQGSAPSFVDTRKELPERFRLLEDSQTQRIG